MFSPVGDHILQFNTLYLTGFRLYKIVRAHTNKERRWPQTDKHLPQSLFTGKFVYDVRKVTGNYQDVRYYAKARYVRQHLGFISMN